MPSTRWRVLAPREGTEAGYGAFFGSVLGDDEGHVFVADDGNGVVGAGGSAPVWSP